MRRPEQTRRSLLLTALVTGTRLAAGMSVAAQEDQPGSDERPQKGDLLSLSEGDGIVAYSVICTWVKAEGGDKNVLKCPCHNSEFNPRESDASRVRAGSAAVCCASAYRRRRLAYRSCNICWKGRCSTTGMRGRGRDGFPRPNDRTTHHGGG